MRRRYERERLVGRALLEARPVVLREVKAGWALVSVAEAELEQREAVEVLLGRTMRFGQTSTMVWPIPTAGRYQDCSREGSNDSPCLAIHQILDWVGS